MKPELVDEFKNRLRRLRDKRGFNNRSLSVAAGLGDTAVRDVLHGKSVEPRYSTIRCLAGALGCQLSDLVPDDPDWPPMPPATAEGRGNLDDSEAFPPKVVEHAVIACDEAARALGKDLAPERRATYVLRLCRWLIGEMRRTGAGSPTSIDQLRQIISFAIHAND